MRFYTSHLIRVDLLLLKVKIISLQQSAVQTLTRKNLIFKYIEIILNCV